MDELNHLNETIHQVFGSRNAARDEALAQARLITRNAAHAIRAIHRGEIEPAHQHLDEARRLVQMVQQALQPFPDLYFSGYTQDAIKEYAEASLTCAIIENQPLPTPEMLGTEYATYLNGLAEVPGELRRRCLDILRQGYSAEAERLLAWMDEIYALLITIDYPDAITYGLRRQTDLVRGIVERTRGDLTLSLREERLHRSMKALATMLPENGEDHAPD
ncbi:MAG TPA: haloacid dehalogenase [Anaerolineaceae bacterium]|nr:haloacid dehalogenase [Chloroflexota bacterium]HQP60346.1 haloacid dehalogenase [Anaerolineaceae bacterium]